MRKYNKSPKKIPGALPQTPPGLSPGPTGGSQHPHRPPPQLIIAIAAQSVSQNSKKNRQA